MPWGMKGWTGRFDDPSYQSPFAQELYAGYMRFQSIDDGSMWSMLNPGAEGVGLHVGQLFEPDCCCGVYGSAYSTAVYKDDNNPWLFPSLVTWKSVMDNNFPYKEFTDNFDIDYPAVALTHVNSSIDEFRWSLNNVNYEGDTDRLSYYPNEDRLFLNDTGIIGIVPLWTVLPLTSQTRTIALQESISTISLSTNLHMLSECWCTLDGMDCDEECARASNYAVACTCLSFERSLEAIEKLYNEPVVIENYLNEETKQTWRAAVNRFYDGWQVVAESAHQGEQWASYWQQAQSPFSALPGQNFRDLLGLTA
jgi:hypothetical protein